MHPNIPFDIWEAIFAAVGEPATLARCALVSRSFWEATARSLYRNVRVAHIDRGREIRGNRAFAAIHAHPYLRAYVRTLTHEAMDVYRWAAHSKDKAYNDEAWADQPPWTTFLPLLPNLTTYTLTTDTHHISDKLLHVVVATLMQCPRLTDVRWMFIVHAGDLPVIMQLNMITHLSLGQPDTGAFSSIGPWLKQMPCLRSFYVRDASRLLPDLISKVVGEEILIRLVNLTLGGRPYLAPYQLLTALNETPDLETLDVYYNDSIREVRPSPAPR
ncbi:hypothetical protein BV25DRAFT_1831063 [Artomyces pyxidatus]|uniref:Uncharacterized protein n=1 Tax=Artomyces pyxidatus TaxID=48021 RepID=A0ACB8SND2_9AGAM|nr:hypothetical protein BV25DRAFT_1831063 [Artomyces pyxidatus]